MDDSENGQASKASGIGALRREAYFPTLPVSIIPDHELCGNNRGSLFELLPDSFSGFPPLLPQFF